MLSHTRPGRIFSAIIAAVLLSSCTSIGPAKLDKDQFDYTASLARGWQSQLLLNFVKLRYGDTPVFLEVTSIVNQYEVESEISLKLVNGIPDNQQLGASGKYINKPTISYSPILGEKFTRSLLTPIPPETVFSLILAGWPADLVLSIAVRSINGLQNTVGGVREIRGSENNYQELILAVRRIQKAGGMGMRIKKQDSGDVSLITFRTAQTDQVANDLRRVRELLGIDVGLTEMPLLFTATRQSKNEIAMLTRSMLDIMSALAAYIAVPEIHVSEGRASHNLPNNSPRLMKVHSASERPLDAFIAVPYRDSWFWVEDTDLQSKHMLSVMVLLFSLVQAGNVSPVAPVLTIPAG